MQNAGMSKALTIRKVELFKLRIPLVEPFVISLGTITHAENLVVRVTTENGIVGFGECSPFLTINGESIDTCFIVGQYLGKVLKGQNASNQEECTDLMDRTIYGNSSIKSALDIAIYDIAAHHANLPLYKFLGGKQAKLLFTDMTVSIGNPDKMKQDAIRFKEAGFPAIKVKLGGTLEEDVARIQAIRDGIGPDHPMRIDANQGWANASAAIEVLQALAPYNIEHCEEPIPRWQFMDLSKVSAASTIPIMADDSCGDHHDAERLIRLKACSMFNIKLGKSSGFFKAKKIIEKAAKNNVHLQVGGFMESRLGMTAAAHLAASSDHVQHCDFDTPLMFTEDPVSGGIQYGQNGSIELPEQPGLGAVLREDVLKEAETIEL